MTRLLDLIFEFCASLKLAVLVILSLAAFLSVATFYEARYGIPAVQTLVYGSNLFLALMAMLAINVMAAAVIRFPWKRKQTGFVITHLGILTLLAGCLISYRFSVDGRVAMRPGDVVKDIALSDERLQIALAGKTWTVPANFWTQAGYPSAFEAFTFRWGQPVWRGPNPVLKLDEGVSLEVLEWMPAAKLRRELTAGDSAGSPGVRIDLSGTTPDGAEVHDSLLLTPAAGETGVTRELFGGMIEVSLSKARSPEEVAAFLAPPTVASLGEHGLITIISRGESQTIPAEKGASGTSGTSARVVEVFPQAEFDGSKLSSGGTEPVAPVARVAVNSGGKVGEFLVSARHPYLSAQISGPELGAGLDGGSHGGGVYLRFDHPAMYAGKRMPGFPLTRLHLLQGPDGKMYRRLFSSGGVSATQVREGEVAAQLMGMKLELARHVPSAVLDERYVTADVAPAKMNEAMRAARVALIVDGQRRESFVARGAAPRGLDTPRGVATLAYGFASYDLPFELALISAKRTNNPGTNDPAAYESTVLLTLPDGGKSKPRLTMNEPLSVGGLHGYTFYQAGFDDSLGTPVSTLSVRKDPGTALKYAGSALMCLGIFLMFYMKAYFQKPTPAKVETQAVDERVYQDATA
jgi:hypothetical protein